MHPETLAPILPRFFWQGILLCRRRSLSSFLVTEFAAKNRSPFANFLHLLATIFDICMSNRIYVSLSEKSPWPKNKSDTAPPPPPPIFLGEICAKIFGFLPLHDTLKNKLGVPPPSNRPHAHVCTSLLPNQISEITLILFYFSDPWWFQKKPPLSIFIQKEPVLNAVIIASRNLAFLTLLYTSHKWSPLRFRNLQSTTRIATRMPAFVTSATGLWIGVQRVWRKFLKVVRFLVVQIKWDRVLSETATER